jgi:general secretion pathway protein G
MLQSMRTIPFLRNFSSKMPKSSRGFTLVELLVVILIIGILGAMMMLLGGSVVDKARATRIVSEMKIMKSAGQFYFCDHGSWPIWAYNEGMGSYRNLSPQGNGILPDAYADKLPVNENYWIGLMYGPDETGKTRIFVILYDQGMHRGTKKKLAEMAKEMQFYAKPDASHTFTNLHLFTEEDDNLMWFM